MNGIIIIGVILSIIASIMLNLGTILQKKGLELLPELNSKTIKELKITLKRFINNRDWLSGAIIGGLGVIPYFLAVSMAGLMIVQPIAMVGLLVFVIFANKLFKEKINKIEIIAISLLLTTPILIILSNVSNLNFNLQEIIVPFTLFIIFISLIIISLLSLSKKYKFVFIIASGIMTSLTSIFTFMLLIMMKEFMTIMHGSSILFVFNLPLWFIGLFLLILVGIAISNIFNWIMCQTCYQKYKATQVVPILNILAMIIPIIASVLIFKQTIENSLYFILAISFTSFSIIILSKFQAKFRVMKNE